LEENKVLVEPIAFIHLARKSLGLLCLVCVPHRFETIHVVSALTNELFESHNDFLY